MRVKMISIFDIIALIIIVILAIGIEIGKNDKDDK